VTLSLFGSGFVPGSVVFVNGLPLSSGLQSGGVLVVPDFLVQLEAALLAVARRTNRHARAHHVEDGTLFVSVFVPGFGLTAPVPLTITEGRERSPDGDRG
jgi:hypothetical protein